MKKLTTQNKPLPKMASLREKFYHPINNWPKLPRTPQRFDLYVWVFLAVLWLAAARSDASVLFP